MVKELIEPVWEDYKIGNYNLLGRFPIISGLSSVEKWKEFIKTKKYVPDNLGVRIKDYFILLFIWSFLLLLIDLPFQLVLGLFTSKMDITKIITSSIGLLILIVLVIFFALFISSLLYFVFAKLLGGKGSFMETLDSVFLSAGSHLFVTFPLSIILTFFAHIPFITCVTNPLQLVISLYGVYLLIHAINSAHKFNSFWKSLAVVILTIVLILIIIAIMFGILLISIFGGVSLLS